MSELAKRGLHTSVILSTPFEKLGRTQAKVFGTPDLPLFMIAHPLGGIGMDDVRKRADQALPRVLEWIAERVR